MIRNIAFYLISLFVPPTLDPVSPELQREIDYGRDLFTHTARYLGKKGSVASNMATRMNCQNCHLDGGKKPYGISIVSTFGRYPEYRARSGKILTLEDRINNCIERPMNGKALPHDSREMKAFLAYFYSMARGVPLGSTIKGGNLNDLVQFPKRAANVQKGQHLFETHCTNCHGTDGLGKLDSDEIEYLFPPLWGEESFNAASNMHRNTKLASFIHANMPWGATVDKPVLSFEESLDVAAFINDESIHPRPRSRWDDYPLVSTKPIDFPHGPYADAFSEKQHRIGPFLEIIEFLKSKDRVAYY